MCIRAIAIFTDYAIYDHSDLQNYWFNLPIKSPVLLFQQIYRSRWRKLGLFLQSLQLILVWKL